MTAEQKQLLDALAAALFAAPPAGPLSREAQEEALRQAVYPLVVDDVAALQRVTKNVQVCYEQDKLAKALEGVPFVILKGLAAAIYYPDPMKRTLGDIDLIVAPEDFTRACAALPAAGFTTDELPDEEKRHVHFCQNGVNIELHRRFASCNTRKQEELLDGWIFAALREPVTAEAGQFRFPMLPEELNGLVLLTHISQHLEGGLGLRQILDWVMFVDKALPDERWESFKEKTDQLGLTTLAIAAARIGQLYLGAYPNKTWCAREDALAAAFLDYAFSCGNFGRKLGKNASVTQVMSQGKGGVLGHLQKRGEANWKALEQHPALKPFAWLYQAGRYAKAGLRRGLSAGDLKQSLDESRKRSELIEKLGGLQLSVREKD